MGNASKKLRKHDDSVMFFKERVKSCVKAYSKGEINQVRYSRTLGDICTMGPTVCSSGIVIETRLITKPSFLQPF